MPRNFSELKSGGDNSYAVPHAEKWGDARPPPIDARDGAQSSKSRVHHHLISTVAWGSVTSFYTAVNHSLTPVA